MLSPEQVQKLPLNLPEQVEKKWDSQRVKELTLCLGAAGIAGLGLIDGFLPRNHEPAPETIIAGPVWPIEADNDMLIEQIPRNPVKDLHDESCIKSSFEPQERSEGLDDTPPLMHPEDLFFSQDTIPLVINPAELALQPAEDTRRQQDYTLAR